MYKVEFSKKETLVSYALLICVLLHAGQLEILMHVFAEYIERVTHFGSFCS